MTEPLRLSIQAPCEDCLHAPVCSMKALLAAPAAQHATLAMPDILNGVTDIQITPRHGGLVFVDCSQFIDVLALKPARKPRATPTRGVTPNGKRIGRPPKIRSLEVVADPKVAEHLAWVKRQERLLPPDPSWSPLCMSDGEWANWQRLNPRLPAGEGRADRPCADCPAEYAAEMRAQGRCNGTPAVAA